MSQAFTEIKLSRYARGAGCGCKIAPQLLHEILGSNPLSFADPRVLVGNQGNEDAAVYDSGGAELLVFTSDFFMPVVDDAFAFGQIAAANALSDVYAMGAKPALALALLGWPVEKLPAALAAEVMRGAREKCAEAGIVIAGGHSVDSAEPLFGLAVNGFVKKEQLKRNNGAKAGDLLYLSKGLGTGILSTAMKRELLQPEDALALVQHMSRLNRIGEELGRISGLHAMTDVTGFGLLGHLMEMMKGAGLSAELKLDKVPRLPELAAYLGLGIFPDAAFRNWNAYQNDLQLAEGADSTLAFQLLPDPQTNGGLLLSVDPEATTDVENLLRSAGCYAEPIGLVQEAGEKLLRVS